MTIFNPVSLAGFGNAGFPEIAFSLVVTLIFANTFALGEALYLLSNAFKMDQLVSAVLVFMDTEKTFSPCGVSLTEWRIRELGYLHFIFLFPSSACLKILN